MYLLDRRVRGVLSHKLPTLLVSVWKLEQGGRDNALRSGSKTESGCSPSCTS